MLWYSTAPFMVGNVSIQFPRVNNLAGHLTRWLCKSQLHRFIGPPTTVECPPGSVQLLYKIIFITQENNYGLLMREYLQWEVILRRISDFYDPVHTQEMGLCPPYQMKSRFDSLIGRYA
jgi:hypothetical protein